MLAGASLVTVIEGSHVRLTCFVNKPLASAELRLAYVLTGDLLSLIEELRALDPILQAASDTPGRAALAAVLDHPYAGDAARFALGTEATALRRRVGATWAG